VFGTALAALGALLYWLVRDEKLLGYVSAATAATFLVLIGAGWVLGTQYHLLEGYLKYLDYLVLAAIVLFVGWYLIRWYRKHHRTA
jgi:membrane protein DedA with SNARE-associated domain